MKIKHILIFLIGLVVVMGTELFSETQNLLQVDFEIGLKGISLAITPILTTGQNLEFSSKDLKPFKLESGMYEAAQLQNISFTEYLEKLEEKEGLEFKGDLAKLSALDRQLLAHDINPFSSATLVEDFFKTTNSPVLFPAFIDRNIYLGMNKGKRTLKLDDLRAASQKIPSKAIELIGMDFGKEDVGLAAVTEGAALPTATIKTTGKSVSMKKVGREILFTYEAVRRMQIDIVSIFFQRVGFRFGRQQVNEGLSVLKDGNNTDSKSPSSTTKDTSWKYEDLVDLIFTKAPDGHEFDCLVLTPEFMYKILTDKDNFPQLQTLNLSEKFVASGEFQNFFGLNWRLHPNAGANTAIAFEQSTCLTYYEEAKSSIIESDKIINKQFERSTISLWFGFVKLFQAASHVKTLKTA
ncbi:hypothetical protein AYB33_18095 [Leptospira santarosai]|uniref:phage major capsid protein n=1 Tax=Leptospira santarosai TaxID=28183 RepID=UPI0007788928|nr:hypothetical protein [Leptospira santarosai]KXZ27177.1 hypothetical protein AYB33_18095 [Leptospira santarosai]